MENMKSEHGNYWKFLVMIATSIIVMFFLMYVHSYQILDHAWFSETRVFMALIMGGAMMIIMLLYMLDMYTSTKLNAAILISGALLLALSIGLVRSQFTVDDVDYMEGMIPHHSIAILTSERSAIEDPRVQKLAKEIIESQRREIKEMKWLIEDIRANGIADTPEEAQNRPVPDFSGDPE